LAVLEDHLEHSCASSVNSVRWIHVQEKHSLPSVTRLSSLFEFSSSLRYRVCVPAKCPAGSFSCRAGKSEPLIMPVNRCFWADRANHRTSNTRLRCEVGFPAAPGLIVTLSPTSVPVLSSCTYCQMTRRSSMASVEDRYVDTRENTPDVGC
jgi:hypothetical protein